MTSEVSLLLQPVALHRKVTRGVMFTTSTEPLYGFILQSLPSQVRRIRQFDIVLRFNVTVIYLSVYVPTQ